MNQESRHERQDAAEDRKQRNAETIRSWMDGPVEPPFANHEARERAAHLIATTVRGPRGYYE